jgi:hypothetical protein
VVYRSFMTRALLAFLVAAAGCSVEPSNPQPSATSGAEVTEGEEDPVAARASAAEPSSPPATPTEFVERLAVALAGDDAVPLDTYVDREFARRLPSGRSLEQILGGYDRERCVLEEDGGYTAVAIPPPMDEPEEEAARIEAIIDELQASTEVVATCTEVETYQESADEPATEHVERRPLFAISVRREGDGTFRALAWRYFPDDMPGGW